LYNLTQDLEPGDCGSWVIDSTEDILFGVVRASSRQLGLTYLTPAYQIIEDLEHMYPKNHIWLRTKSDISRLIRSISTANKSTIKSSLQVFSAPVKYLFTESDISKDAQGQSVDSLAIAAAADPTENTADSRWSPRKLHDAIQKWERMNREKDGSVTHLKLSTTTNMSMQELSGVNLVWRPHRIWNGHITQTRVMIYKH
jgi:hypothetical protein